MKTYQKVLVGIGVAGIILGIPYNLNRNENKPAPVPRVIEHRYHTVSHPSASTDIESPNMMVRITDAGSFSPHYRRVEMGRDGAVLYEEGSTISTTPDKVVKGRMEKKQTEKIRRLIERNELVVLNGKKFDNPKVYDSNTITTVFFLDGQQYSMSEYADSGPEYLHKTNSEIWELATNSVGIESELYSDIQKALGSFFEDIGKKN